ncbi:hypothetical protein CCP3SC15_30057 [Gammaproteobacteria bacterium]
MRTEINASRPAVGYIPDHAVVVDGYRYESNSDFFHVNYGWGETSNGWYFLNAIPGGGLSGFHAVKPSYNPLLESAAYLSGTSDINVQWQSPAKVTPPIERFRISVPNDQYHAAWIDDATNLTNWTTGPSSPGAWQPTLNDGKTTSTCYSGECPRQLAGADQCDRPKRL